MTKEDIIRVKVSQVTKLEVSPFIGEDYLKIDRKKRTIIAGSTSRVLMDTDTGEVEGITLMHKYKEVDRTTFVKLFINEVSALFELSKAGLKTFGYILGCLEINKDTVYIYFPDLMKYADWNSTKQVYRGLGELIANKIIAPSTKPNIWFINPNILFNGDRIAFVKEYRLKKEKPITKQLGAFPDEENNMSSATLHE